MKLALGGAQFGFAYGVSNSTGQVPRQEARKIVSLARLAGVDTIDTAISYGDSEICLGEIGVGDFRVVTKLPPMPDDIADAADWVRGQITGSLNRLGVARVHGLLLHRADQLLGKQGQTLASALLRARQDGLVGKVGVSIYDPEQLAAIMPVCTPDIVQAPLNLLDRRLETSGWLQRLHDVGVEVHTRSAFLQGLLVMNQATMPPRFGRWRVLWDTWQTWLDAHGVSATRACLQYPLSFPQVDRVVVGVSSTAEFRMLLDDAAVVATTTELPDLACTDMDLINPSNWNRL
ncbi:MAG: aldo/keto reductase [Candidatus Moraniibacteriota bacterium]|nr:MAG: aldo/keto reductase [Candidatus Moranbacteria bacterium]